MGDCCTEPINLQESVWHHTHPQYGYEMVDTILTCLKCESWWYA